MAAQNTTAIYGRECLNWPIFERSLAKNQYFYSTFYKVLEWYKMLIIANLEGYLSYNVDLRV